VDGEIFLFGFALFTGHEGPSGFSGLGVSMLASGTQDRGFAPDRSRRIFPDGKIHSMPSFGRGSKNNLSHVSHSYKKVKKVKTVNYGTKKKALRESIGIALLCFQTSALEGGEG
jgi:hypothetical protein